MTDPSEFPGEKPDQIMSEQTRQRLIGFVESVVPSEVSSTLKYGHLVMEEGVELDFEYSADDNDSQAKIFIEDHRGEGFPIRSIIELLIEHDEDGMLYLAHEVTDGITGRDIRLDQLTNGTFSEVMQTFQNSSVYDVTTDICSEVISLLKGERVFTDDGRILGFPSATHQQIAPTREQASELAVQVAAVETPETNLTYSYCTRLLVADGIELCVYKEDNMIDSKSVVRWGIQLSDDITDTMTHLVVDSTGQAKLVTPSNIPYYDFGLDIPSLLAHRSFMEEIGQLEAHEHEAQDVLEFMKVLYEKHRTQKSD